MTGGNVCYWAYADLADYSANFGKDLYNFANYIAIVGVL